MKTINKQTIYIEASGKKYPLVISYTGKIDPTDGELVFVECDLLGMRQDYLRADLPLLIADLPILIDEELADSQSTQINLRISTRDKSAIEENSKKYGFSSVSDFLKTLGKNPEKFLSYK